jgi:hypothetical protein
MEATDSRITGMAVVRSDIFPPSGYVLFAIFYRDMYTTARSLHGKVTKLGGFDGKRATSARNGKSNP